MPFGTKPSCIVCKTMNSTMWRRNGIRQILCNSCFLSQQQQAESNNVEKSRTSNNKQNNNGGKSQNGRKSKGNRKLRHKQSFHTATKGKSRRIIFKRNPLKSPASVSTVVTSNGIFYQGVYIQVGDIVSILDVDEGIYYAQIRGLLQDQYCQKSAIITWLLPTQASNKAQFDPSTYILGPDEDIPRSLEYMEFVCHCPSEYFKQKDSPYPVIPPRNDKNFVWTTIGPKQLPTANQIFGSNL
ncbi:GATA zinc finger domain-containing protein 1-like [Anneissia japonica]|uniref:GATA zinc finger domain-containing protein 1-like n=1 Tax=Anneissia japonica TaxID=1529436 RepID=UPI001425A9D0|nr:GATA zinc finger domain-containing protein 1-like [Anneissia japonica]XP_033121362.1 GATA zinc finger domain-containing protein 1-like [Anneissia japonica]